jgi:hypothetical protein
MLTSAASTLAVVCVAGLAAAPAAQRPAAPAKPPLDASKFEQLPPLDVAAATTAAVAALLQLAEGDAREQWPYEGVYRDVDGIPLGYRVGGTAIVCLAFVAAPGYGEDKERQAALQRGVAFVLKSLDEPRMAVAFDGKYDVRGWGHIYALQLFLTLQDQKLVPKAHADAILAKTPWLVQALVASAIPEAGGWNYSRPGGYLSASNRASTFMTAPALQALFFASARGHTVPAKVIDEALTALERARAEPGGYAYGAPPQSQAEVGEDKLSMMDKTPSSAARATAVESTLLLAGRGDQARLLRAIERFFSNWDALAVRKSQLGTHIMPYGIAPYYFMYGHWYAAQAIELLADDKAKVALRERMRQYLARSRDTDGSWNDRHFDRSAGYGTALAILAMQMPKLPLPVAMPLPAKKG